MKKKKNNNNNKKNIKISFEKWKKNENIVEK